MCFADGPPLFQREDDPDAILRYVKNCVADRVFESFQVLKPIQLLYGLSVAPDGDVTNIHMASPGVSVVVLVARVHAPLVLL